MPSYFSSTPHAFAQPFDNRLRRRLRAGQHEVDRLKRAQRNLLQRPLPRRHRRGAEVAAQHVRLADCFARPRERRRNRFLHQPLFQPDAQIARDDLDQIFRRPRIEPREPLLQQRLLVPAARAASRAHRKSAAAPTRPTVPAASAPSAPPPSSRRCPNSAGRSRDNPLHSPPIPPAARP